MNLVAALMVLGMVYGVCMVAYASSDEGFSVAISWNNLDEIPIKEQALLEEMFAERGWEYTDTDAGKVPGQQLADVETLIQLDPDVIIIRLDDANAGVAMVDLCNEAEIPVLFLDAGLDPENEYYGTERYVTFVGDSDKDVGMMWAEVINQWIEDHPGETANVGYLIGSYSFATTMARSDKLSGQYTRCCQCWLKRL